MKIMNKDYSKVPFLLFYYFLLFFPVVIFADDSATARMLLDHMSRATRELNYDGIFIYTRGEQMDTMRLIHKADKDGEIERLISLTGYAREIIRNNKSVTCIFPDNQEVIVEKSRTQKLLSTQLSDSIENITDYYKFSVTDRDRVAGRDAKIVTISPKDDYRYGYQWWVDKDSYLLLKSELKNNSGQILEQILFTKIDVLDTISDELLKPSISGAGYTWYNSPEIVPNKEVSKNNIWSVNWMPAGFNMSDYEKQPMIISNTPVEHMVYTDGLAMISIFIEALNDQPQFTMGFSKLGAVNAFSKLINGYQVTVVGEVPALTVEKMSNSVQFRKYSE